MDFALKLCLRVRDPPDPVREFRIIRLDGAEPAFKLPRDFVRRRTPRDALRHRDPLRIKT